MGKTMIILPRFSAPRTGGQKFDFLLVNQLKKIDPSIETLCDHDLHFAPKISIWYNFLYLLKFKDISNNCFVITNSRLYPRMWLFFSVFKLLNRNTKTVCIHHHYNFMTKKGMSRYVHRFFEVGFLKKFDRIVIPSPYVYDLSSSLIPNKKLDYLAIAFARKMGHVRQKRQMKGKLLYVGTIEKRKGIHLLIESLKGINENFKLTLAGKYSKEDPYYIKLKKKIKKYNLSDKVFFSGWVSDAQITSFFKEASIFVFPSLHEGYGMVIMEAMGYGLPVVAFNNSAIPYLIKKEYNGMLAENGDYEDLRNKILYMLRKKDKYSEMSRNAINTYKNTRTIEDLDKDIKKFYNNLTNEN